MKSIEQILKFLSINESPKHLAQWLAQPVHVITDDSRLCDANSVFIALKGQNFDGHNYIDQALHKGAALVLVECEVTADSRHDSVLFVGQLRDKLSEFASWFYDDPSKKIPVIAITGTNGKTSVCHFIAQFTSTLSKKIALLGTVGNGIYPDLQVSTHTTLNTLLLNQKLQTFVENHVDLIAMEASSHAIEQKRIENLNLDCAVFTNLDEDHLDYHKDMESYFNVKRSLFTTKGLQNAIINIDDNYALRLYENLKTLNHIKRFTVSTQNKQANYYFKIIKCHAYGIDVNIYVAQCFYRCCTLPVLGQYNVMNIALAFAALIQVGYKKDDLLSSVAYLNGAKGRMEVLKPDQQQFAPVIIDFAHTAGALKNVLIAIKPQVIGRLICVFGCGGDRQRSKRPLMAQAAQSYADFCIVTEDNNRLEGFETIAKDMVSGFDQTCHDYVVIACREKAIKYAIKLAKPSDVILLAGKGHEMYLDKNGIKMHFDERQVVRNIWSKK